MWQTTWLTAVHTLIPVSHRPCGGTMTLWAASCHKAAQSKQLHQAAAEKFRKLCDHVNLTRKNTLAHKKQVVEFPRNICLRFSSIKPLLFFKVMKRKYITSSLIIQIMNLNEYMNSSAKASHFNQHSSTVFKLTVHFWLTNFYCKCCVLC